MRRIFTLLIVLLASSLAMAQEPTELEKKVAQMLVVGFRGTELKDGDTSAEEIKKYGVGGVILFEHNIAPAGQGIDSKARLQKLNSDLQALSSEPIMLAVDQEGGRVNRLKTKYGFPTMISAEEVSAMGDEDARGVASTIAMAVKDAGFNTNFAPCVDVNINPLCPIIGKVKRSYGADPETVAHYGSLFVEEHRKAGVLTSLKHFPGHGSAAVDTHKGFADVSSSWQEKELIPYKIMFASGLCDMVMITHVFNSNIDPKYPASLSSLTIDGLLRDEMGWDGIVITDDMQMGAITNNYSFEDGLILAVNAGVDMLIVSNSAKQSGETIFKRSLDVIVAAVKSGKISYSQIDKAYQRIMRFKSRMK